MARFGKLGWAVCSPLNLLFFSHCDLFFLWFACVNSRKYYNVTLILQFPKPFFRVQLAELGVLYRDGALYLVLSAECLEVFVCSALYLGFFLPSLGSHSPRFFSSQPWPLSFLVSW